MSSKATEIEILEMLRNPQERDRRFRLLLSTYGDKLYWHIRRMVVSREDAEDAMQEMSIKVYSKLDSFKGDSSLFTWMYTIATNEALQVLRKQAGLFRSLDDSDLANSLVDTLYAENAVECSAAEIIFQEALLQLPTQQRLAFNMRYYDELTYEEMAAVTGKNVSTLKSNYHFAVEKVMIFIKENAI